MSLVNSLCTDLDVTVRKRDETLQLHFRDGKLDDSNRTKVASGETGITVAGTINSQLSDVGVDVQRLRHWLLEVAAFSPSLKLFFNGLALKSQ
jgi:DNA gyrase/topoisomerase IV subunit B